MTFVDQPSREGRVFIVAGVVADDVDRAFGVGGEQLPVEPLGTLGVDAVGLIEVHLGGGSGR